MSVAGGLSMAAIHLVNTGLPHWNVGLKCLLCAVLITEIEWIIGCAVNLSRKNKVWDYSHLPFHYHGQICLPYSLLWLALSFVALPLSGQIAVRIH